MESAALQREQTKSEPTVHNARSVRPPVTTASHWPLTFNDGGSPALRLGHAFGLSHASLPPGLQAKLTVNTPGDQYEQEADRVAEQVMRMPGPAVGLQRKCSCGGASSSHESCAECASQPVQLQRRAASASSFAEAPAIVHDVLSSPGHALNQNTREFFERRFDHDFSNVRIHTDDRAAKSAQAVNALAYTVGHNVVFGAGQYAPNSYLGQKLLAHELAHVT